MSYHTSIVDYFDIGNYEHLYAWRRLEQTGFWPSDFWNKIKHFDFPDAWQVSIMAKMAKAYLTTTLNAMEFGHA